MALDRQSIEKKDFPIGRRGYDPEAVDAHLAAVAEEVDQFKSSARRRADSLAETAAEQVRAIVEAAEASASQIRADAEKDARDIRREARSEAKQAREEATAQAGQYVSNVSTATTSMIDRLDAIEQEMGTLVDSLRTSLSRASSDLQLLEGHLVEVKDAVSPRHEFEPEPEPEPGADGELEPQAALDEQFEQEFEAVSSAPEATPEISEEEFAFDEAEVSQAGVVGEAGDAETEFTDDTEGARLIALNMALNGTPRDEVDRYLAENFDLSDRAGLIEEVYSSVEG